MTLFSGRFENPKDIKKILNRIFLYEDILNEAVGSDIYLFYIDLKEALMKIKLTRNEKRALSLWTKGYNSKQISEIMKKDKDNIQRSLRRVCEKLYGELK